MNPSETFPPASPRRKIAFVIDSLTGGGAERLVLTIAETMAERGHEVILITMTDKIEYQIDPRLTCHHLTSLSQGSASKDHMAKRLITVFAQLEQSGAIDLVVVNLNLSSEVVRLSGIPGAYFCINNSLAEQLRFTRNPLVRPYWRHKLRQLYQGQNLICVSQGVARDCTDTLKVQPNHCEVIPNGFNFSQIRSLAANTVDAAISHSPYVLFVGHFKRQKRVDLLLAAWAKVPPGHQLVILGNGSGRKTRQLQKLARHLGIEQRTVFAGWHENAYAWMAQAELLVLSSDFEGFGRVIVEALAVGTPVVSTRCPSGPDEILTGEHSQWLVPRNDSDALAAKISQALASPPTVDPAMVDTFDIEHVVDRYLALPARTGH